MVKIKKVPKKIKITVSDTPIYLPLSLQESIDSYWESLIASGKTFFRGELFSIKELKETENELLATLQKTDFAHFLYAKHYKVPDPFKCRALVANGLFLTEGNYYILGQMNNSTAAPGRIQFIAGGIDGNDISGDTVDMFGSLTREAKEEIGIDLTDQSLVLKVEPRYIVHWGSVALIYRIELSLSVAEFEVQYEAFEKSLHEKGIEPEFSSIVVVSADDAAVSDFLEWDQRPKLEFLPAVLRKEMEAIPENL